jgi:hypothetical protein
MCNITTQLIKYEDGELTHEETVCLFQELLDTGMIDHLQGSYARVALHLYNNGEIA